MAHQGEAPAAQDGRGGWLSAQEAAARAGVAWKTWTAYAARGQAPRHGRRNPGTGRPEWRAEAVDAWLASRPGRGARRDLRAAG